MTGPTPTNFHLRTVKPRSPIPAGSVPQDEAPTQLHLGTLGVRKAPMQPGSESSEVHRAEDAQDWMAPLIRQVSEEIGDGPISVSPGMTARIKGDRDRRIADFEIVRRFATEPEAKESLCLRVLLAAGPVEAPSSVLMQAVLSGLNDPKVGGRYENLDGEFELDDGWFSLSVALPESTSRKEAVSMAYELQTVGLFWSYRWLREVIQIVKGDAKPPDGMVDRESIHYLLVDPANPALVTTSIWENEQ